MGSLGEGYNWQKRGVFRRCSRNRGRELELSRVLIWGFLWVSLLRNIRWVRRERGFAAVE